MKRNDLRPTAYIFGHIDSFPLQPPSVVCTATRDLRAYFSHIFLSHEIVDSRALLHILHGYRILLSLHFVVAFHLVAISMTNEFYFFFSSFLLARLKPTSYIYIHNNVFFSLNLARGIFLVFLIFSQNFIFVSFSTRVVNENEQIARAIDVILR